MGTLLEAMARAETAYAGRTSLGFYARRESAPQGADVSIEEHEVQP
jgi:hypothetical protein